MEEGASFWSPKLSWRSFAAACVTAVVSYLLDLAMSKQLRFSVNDMSIYSGLPGERPNGQYYPSFQVWDYVVFCIIGVAGGTLGALWIAANRKLTIFRKKRGLKRVGKYFELLALTTLVSAVFWFLPLLYQVCGNISDTLAEDKTIFRQMTCPDGQYNHLGTLFLNPPGSVVLNLLYWEPVETFSPVTLMIAGTCYLCLLLLLFGTSIAMGIFIPLLYIGACFGRAAATWSDVGSDITVTWTIVASAGMLAGVVRVLISLTAIMLCTTGLPHMVTPFMLVTMFAKVTGKAVFDQPGIYDMILEMKGIPFLEAEPPKSMRMRGLRAQDIMSSSPLITLQPEQDVTELVEYLQQHPTFADFPVVDPNHGGILLGVITRDDLYIILTHSDLFYVPEEVETAQNNQSCSQEDPQEAGPPHESRRTVKRRTKRKALKLEELVRQRYRGIPTMERIVEVTTSEGGCSGGKAIDLTPYLEIGHYTINRMVSVERTFELFRTLGLRYLIVTDSNGVPVGTVTRSDLKLLEEVDVDEVRLAEKKNNVGVYQIS
jgi:chloride channel 7